MTSLPQKNQKGNGGFSATRTAGKDSQLVDIILEELKEVVFSAPEVLEALEVASGEHTLNAKERALGSIHQVMSAVVNDVCIRQEKGYQGSKTECSCCGGDARFVRHERKTIVTLAGPMNISRSLYECMEQDCKNRWRPLDEKLQCPAGRYSESVRRVISLMGAHLPFERAAEVLWDTARVEVSASQVRKITEHVGEDMGKVIQEEVAEHQAGSLESLPPTEVLVIGTDGAHLNTREGSWKETKVGSIRRYQRVDEETLKLTGSTFTAHLGSADDFRPKFDAEIARQGSKGHEATIFLGDGARWIWNMAAEIAPDAVHVLDYFHLCEHVWDAGKALLGESSPDLEGWAKTITEQLLRQGKIQEAIDKVEATIPFTAVPQGKAKEEQRKLIQYIKTNSEHMSYPCLEAHGYPIGSGHVESACKQIVSQRHKQAGMRWSKSGAQHMLNLAAFYHGNRWNEYWMPRVV